MEPLKIDRDAMHLPDMFGLQQETVDAFVFELGPLIQPWRAGKKLAGELIDQVAGMAKTEEERAWLLMTLAQEMLVTMMQWQQEREDELELMKETGRTKSGIIVDLSKA